MQKKRNTPSRDDSLFTWRDLLVVLLCVGVIAFSLYLFWLSLNQVLVRKGEEPVATITYKYKSAQRKLFDRAIWDRLRQASDVYNEDTIRTAPMSEATVWFNDGSSLELHGNTLVTISVSEDKTAVALAEGNVSIHSKDTAISLSSGNTVITLEKDSALQVVQSRDEGLRLQVDEGAAVFSSPAGDELDLNAGDALENGERPLLTVLSPGERQKILNQSSESLTIPFRWKTSGLDEGAGLVLDIASDSRFDKITQSMEIRDLESLNLDLPSGKHYWRLYPEDSGPHGDGAKSGRLQILSAPSPNPIAPVEDYLYNYRKKTPGVRFLWSTNPYCSSWLLEVADNPEMEGPVLSRESSSGSMVVSSLGPGNWFWRVTPRYSIGKIVDGQPSPVSSFRIVQKGELLPPVLKFPAPKSQVNTGAGHRVLFSWKNDPEAQAYTLRISAKEDMSRSIIERQVSQNYMALDKARESLSNGRWFWTVFKTDDEGNSSQEAPVQSFLAMDSELIYKSIFPPESYGLAESLVFDTLFTWKSNIPSGSRFQVSASKDFEDLLYDISKQPSAAGQKGLSLAEGSWYWRLVSDAESLGLQTEAKKLISLGALDAPVITEPLQRAVVRPNTPYTFQWDAVPEADYYHFSLYYGNEREEAIFEKLFFEGTSLSLDMENMKEGMYSIKIQAAADETPFSSRRIGRFTIHPFIMKKLKPVKLLTPGNGARILGRTALLRPLKVRWSTVDTPVSSRFILRKTGSRKPVLLVKDPSLSVQLPSLSAGRYSWTVEARTADDLDISALEPSFFTVLPIPPLAAPKALMPPEGTVFGVEYFKQNQTLKFGWDKVRDAEKYVLKIKNGDGKILVEKTLGNENSFVFEDLARLSIGEISWSVSAKNPIQNGITARSSFTIDLPREIKTEIKDTGVLYGR